MQQQQPLQLPDGLKRVIWISYPLHVLEFVKAAVQLLNEHGLSVDLWTAPEWPGRAILNDRSILFIITRGLELQKCPVIPAHFIIHQVEQRGSAALKQKNSTYVFFLKRALRIWEYSQLNEEFLVKQLGLANVSLLPFGYHRSLEILKPAKLPPVDILFLGQPCQRRNQILELFKRAGLSVQSFGNVFGPEKLSLISRAKIVLNLHYYVDPSVLETERLALLLANKKCIVSESSSEPEIDRIYAQGVVFESEPDELIQRCKELLADEVLRRSVEDQAYEWFSSEKLIDNWQDFSTLLQYFKAK